MHTLSHSPCPPLPAVFTIFLLILACLALLFFSTKQSASKDIKTLPASGLEDVAQQQFPAGQKDLRP
jgi:hypothetical protein